MTPFDFVYQELGIKCGLDWLFTTPSGLLSLALSIAGGIYAACLTNKIEP